MKIKYIFGKHNDFSHQAKKIFAGIFILTSLILSVWSQSQTFYWEYPKSMVKKEALFPVTLNTDSDSFVIWQDVDTSNRRVHLSLRHYTNLTTYTDNLQFTKDKSNPRKGGFPYAGEIPSIFSAAVSPSGEIVIAVSSGISQITIFKSSDKGKTFERKELNLDSSILDPRVYYSNSGKFILFGSATVNNSYRLYISESKNGLSWSGFEEFTPSVNQNNAFVPYLVSNSQGDMVVFQARYSSANAKPSYQLFGTWRNNDGAWNSAKLITDRQSLKTDDRRKFEEYANQRPNLFSYNDKIYMVWERGVGSDTALWAAELNSDGMVPKTAVQISQSGSASRGILFEYNGNLYSEWYSKFTNASERIYYSVFDGRKWSSEVTIPASRTDNHMFPCPLIIKDTVDENKTYLSFVWQQVKKSGSAATNTISLLSPDLSVRAPTLSPVTYKSGKRSRDKNVQIQINFPDDSSGISGYSYTWGKDNQEIPPAELEYTVSRQNTSSTVLKMTADGDGEYWLYVRVRDKAGNWSDSAKITYYRDITPPKAPVINRPKLDTYGMLDSNTFQISWKAPDDNDVAGYNYEIDYLGNLPKNLVVNKTHKIQLTKSQAVSEVNKLKARYSKDESSKTPLKANIKTSRTYTPANENQNNRNGVYLISVSAIDQVGNVSQSSKMLLVLNKYTPVTVISYVSSDTDNVGRSTYSVRGEGFTYEGLIEEIYIDLDGKAPYDLVLRRSNNDFKVESDTLITGIKIGTYLDKGVYRIGLNHSDRGITFSPAIFDIKQTGTLKIQPEYVYRPRYTPVEIYSRYIISISMIIVITMTLLLFGIPQMLIWVIIQQVKDRKISKKEIKALITGENMPLLTNSNTSKKSKKTLRTRIVFFTVALVALVVAIITWRNALNMSQIQQTTLVSALEERINVLMVSLNSGIKNYFPEENINEIGLLPAQTEGMAEIKYVTILGRRRDIQPDDPDYGDLTYVWASNDPDISDKIVTQVGTQSSNSLIAGRSKIVDTDMLQNMQQLSLAQEEAKTRIWSKLQEININTTEMLKMYDDKDYDNGDKLALRNTEIRKEITRTLTDLSSEKGYTVPVLTSDLLHSSTTDYVFYRPVLYNIGSSDTYFNGVIVLEVTVQDLVDQITREVRGNIIQGIILGVIAIIIGIFGAWIVAGFIVTPIRKLEKHLYTVGSFLTKDPEVKKRLENIQIKISSKDEVGRLSEVVNNMAYSVGLSAKEDTILVDGQKVQNCFIPLDVGENYEKTSFAHFNEDKLEMFAFYKGDSKVSGDYFDYRKLDNNWYVFIKGDVSGHGVAAALLVSVVATKFKEFYYLGGWDRKKDGININKFVEAVNEFLNELNTSGKFCAINVSMFNKETGEVYICNAGDKKIHVYEESTRKLKEITLFDSPAAGQIAAFMVEAKGGFKIEKLTLQPGDILYLYTDGIDEAERKVREKNFEIRREKIDTSDGSKKTDSQNEVKEQFGQERINKVIEAVHAKSKFVLEKEDNPVNEYLEFDFSDCDGTIEDAVLALVAIERVFRFVKTPDITENDESEKIERKVDDFLKKTFNLYTKYCNPNEDEIQIREEYKKYKEEKDAGNTPARRVILPSELRYCNIHEDKQADDITIVGIRRPKNLNS